MILDQKLNSQKILRATIFLESELPKLSERVQKLKNIYDITPLLQVILIGNDPASEIYVQKKILQAKELGITSHLHRFTTDVSVDFIFSLITEWNNDPLVHGILLQRPLPPQFKESEVLYWIHPSKDVDGFHPENFGNIALGSQRGFTSCTPKGIMSLLDFNQLNVEGKIVCVLGRSQNLGNPLAQLLLKRNATLIHCHSKTKNLKEMTKLADFIFVAIGKPKFLTEDFIKEGAVIVDVGIHKQPDGTLCGDVDFNSVFQKCSFITPVPGGVGPLTIFTLMENTIISAENELKRLNAKTNPSF